MKTKKKCSICKITKNINLFTFRNDSKKYRNECKYCKYKRDKEWRNKNKKELAIKNRGYRKKNKKKIAEKQREWRRTHVEESRAYQKEYRQKHKKILRVKANIRRKKNREKIAAVRRKYENGLMKTSISYKLRRTFSAAIWFALKSNGGNKGGKSIINHLPYTIDQLKAHLEKLFEPWMNWENHGKYLIHKWNDKDKSTWTWQIDHIIPQSALPYLSMEDKNFKKCWALKNLQPLSSKENQQKGDKIIAHKSKRKK